MSNIRELELLSAAAKRPPRFDLGRFWTNWAKEFEARLLKERAVVKLSPAGLRALRGVNEAAAEAARENGQPCKPDGWIKADIAIETVEHATGQLLRLGADVEVLKPPALREAVAREAQKIARLYTS